MKPVLAGRLRERVTLQLAARAKGTMGGLNTTWSTVAQVWADVEQIAGADQQDQGQKRESKSYKVTIRSRDVSATENRLLWKGTLLDIVEVVDDPRVKRTNLTCVSGRGGVG